MSKTYKAPALTANGKVVDLTQFGTGGHGDMVNPTIGLGAAPGSMGFHL